MPIYINKNGQQSGPYEDHIVIDQLRSGVLSPEDLAIRHGDASWQSLANMFPGVGPARVSDPPPIGVSGATIGQVAPAAPAAKKGGCLKGGLIGAGILLLLLGI